MFHSASKNRFIGVCKSQISNLAYIMYSNFGPHFQENTVSWSSRLWHLLNTQNVPSSILGEITFSFFNLPLPEIT